MELYFAALIGVIALLLLLFAIVLVTRDAMGRKEDPRRRRLGVEDTGEGKRLTVADRRQPPTTVAGRMSRSFDRMIGEASEKLTPGGARLLMLLVATILGGVVLWAFDSPLGGFLAFLGGMAIPAVIIWLMRGYRRRNIERQLPEALYLLARAVRAGESPDQAIALVARETQAPLGTEFERCARQLEMGLSMDVTMRSLARRTNLPDLRLFATILMVHRQTGGNLSLTLERIADVMRNRQDYRRHFRATTAGGRLSTFVIASLAVFAVVFLAIFQTEYIERMMQGPIGWSLLILAVTLQVIGILWIFAMTRTQY